MNIFDLVHIRKAEFYVNRIMTLENEYRQGGEHTYAALAKFDADLAQIVDTFQVLIPLAKRNADVIPLCLDYVLSGINLFTLRFDARDLLAMKQEVYALIRDKIDQHPNSAYIIANMVSDYAHLDEYEAAFALADEAMVVAHRADNKDSMMVVQAALGNAYMVRGEYDMAYQRFVVAFDMDEPYQAFAGAISLGNIAMRNEDYATALDHYSKAHVLAQQSGNPRELIVVLNNLAQVQTSFGRFYLAIDYANEALAHCRKIGDKNSEGTVLGFLGEIHCKLFGVAQGLSYLLDALQVAETTNKRGSIGFHNMNVGNIYTRLGQREKALHHLYTAAKIFEEIGTTEWSEALEGLIRFNKDPKNRIISIAWRLLKRPETTRIK
jgi:tetratricopeptide (TPR) repeat protein